jgi:dTDP-4-amino-4,6-dideoxygalactose transaminase
VQQGEAENVYYSFPVLLTAGLREVTQYGRKKGVEVHQAFDGSVLALRELPDDGFPNARPFLLRCVLFPLYPSLGKKNVTLVERVLTTLP